MLMRLRTIYLGRLHDQGRLHAPLRLLHLISGASLSHHFQLLRTAINMTGNKELRARLKHLDGAACLLAVTAPSISQYLAFKHNTLAFDHEADISSEHTKKACTACGTPVKPGVNGKLEKTHKGTREGKSARGTQSTSTQARIQTRIYTCFTCGRYTRTTSRYPKRTSRGKNQNVIAATVAASVTPTEQKPITTSTTHNAAIKKTKSLKKSGLAALLAQQKSTQSSSSGFGLNLMDFMKRP